VTARGLSRSGVAALRRFNIAAKPAGCVGIQTGILGVRAASVSQGFLELFELV